MTREERREYMRKWRKKNPTLNRQQNKKDVRAYRARQKAKYQRLEKLVSDFFRYAKEANSFNDAGQATTNKQGEEK